MCLFVCMRVCALSVCKLGNPVADSRGVYAVRLEWALSAQRVLGIRVLKHPRTDGDTGFRLSIARFCVRTPCSLLLPELVKNNARYPLVSFLSFVFLFCQ